MAAKEETLPAMQMRKYLEENFSDLSQVYAAHKESLANCEEEIAQWKKFIKDYNVLQNKLTTYPDKTSYDEVIPICSLAYMKGKKIHTNEILVHLGENWFAERSVKDAIQIIDRRRKVCEEKLKITQRNKEIHEGWMKQTTELAKEKDNVEILEQISEEQYQKDKEKHREMVAKRVSLVSSEETISDKETISSEMRSFEDLLKRLDLLQDQERMNNELSGGIAEEDESENRAKLLRRVSWADNLIVPTEITEENETEGGHSESPNRSSATAKIKYRSRQQSLPVELISGNWEGSETGKSEDGKLNSPSEEMYSPSGAGTPQSPSDLYKMIVETPITVPPAKGILKKKSDPSQHSDVEKGVGWSDNNDTLMYIPPSPDEIEVPIKNAPLSESPREIKNLKTAFSYKIVPHELSEEGGSSSASSSDVPAPPQDTTPSEDEPKVVSRFKASRMNKQGGNDPS